MKTKDEILELIEDRYFQLMLEYILLEQSKDTLRGESINSRIINIKGMIDAYIYAISDSESELEIISQLQIKLAFERFSRTSLATEVNITNLRKYLICEQE
jgi:hypothetical protein